MNPIAAIAAPFFVGLVTDRYFATQKALGTLHLIGGLVDPGRGRDRFGGAAAHHRRGVGYAFRLTNR
ncbi:MAG TPA: hypothetical protein VHE82_10120 [Gemmatimonadaceae bacterium]|nr:hypothetical protein [Gemmatimonadaceae bacterium]